jgi:hypothetical protein
MTDQNIQQMPETNNGANKSAVTTGIILIAIGVSLLVFRIIDLSQLFPLVLGLGFLLSGALTRKTGLIIPGGIISGVGLGIVALSNNWFTPTNEPSSGGVFLLAFSLGWFSIPLLTRLFTGQAELWPLIPGGILATIGALILGGEQGLAILKVVGDYWPLVLVAIGVWILIQYFRKQ